MSRRVKFTILGIAALFLSLASMAQTSVQGQTSFPLDCSGVTDTISIPVKPVGGLKLPGERPLLVKLANNRISTMHRNAIRLRLDPSLPLIDMEVNTLVFNKPGTYEVDILCLSGTKDSATLVVFLTRPAAMLDTPPTLHINMEGQTVKADALFLHEKGGNSGISFLRLSSPNIRGVDTGNLLTFDSAAYGLSANGFLKAAYRVQRKIVSDLPLGTTTGQLWISAPELAAPVAVNIEIKNTLNKVFIIVFLLLGLLLGGLVRHFLQDRKDGEEARMKGLTLVQQIDTESSVATDEAYRKSVKDLLDKLTPLLEGKTGLFPGGLSGSELIAKINETSAQYTAGRTAFLASIESKRTLLLQFGGLFLNSSLNPELKARLGEPIAAFNKARQYLDVQAPTAAEEEMDKGQKAATKILDSLLLYFKGFGSLPAILYPKDVPAGVRESAQKYFDEIDKVVNSMTPAVGTPELLVKNTLAVDSIFEYKRDLFNYLDTQLDIIYRDLKVPPTEQGLLASAKEALAQYKGILNAVNLNPRGLQDPREYWDATLIAKLDAAWDAAKAKETTTMGDADETAKKPALAVIDRIQFLKKGTSVHNPFSVIPTLDLQQLAKWSWLRWVAYTGLRTFILMLLMSLGAYKYYEASFIGDWGELIGILLFAFSLDVTVENVALLRDKKP